MKGGERERDGGGRKREEWRGERDGGGRRGERWRKEGWRKEEKGGGMEGGEKGGMDGEGWRGHGVVWSEGGRGSRAHSPELVVAPVLVITPVFVVAHVLVITPVFVVARVHSWALAVIREPWGAVVAGGGSRTSCFMGDGEGRSSLWLVVVACESGCGGGSLLSMRGRLWSFVCQCGHSSWGVSHFLA